MKTGVASTRTCKHSVLYFTSKVGPIAESANNLPVFVNHIQYSVLDEVHLGSDGPILCDIVPRQEYVEGDPGNYGANEGLAGRGKERDHSD